MTENINTKNYWDDRFRTRDWELKGGREQTRRFAHEQCPRLGLPETFAGSLTDFGCGLGDAMPVYHAYFPHAELRGYDLANEAITKCRKRYGGLARFWQGTEEVVEYSDVIVASNVFEHLSNQLRVLEVLRRKCRTLYVIVPYKEKLTPNSEHVNSYDEQTFTGLAKRCLVYETQGMTPDNMWMYCNIYIKNLFRLLTKLPIVRIRNKQIMYVFE